MLCIVGPDTIGLALLLGGCVCPNCTAQLTSYDTISENSEWHLPKMAGPQNILFYEETAAGSTRDASLCNSQFTGYLISSKSLRTIY